MRIGIRITRALTAFAVAAAAIIACEETDSYVFTAQRYDPDAACLDPYKSIEVVPGPSVSSRCPRTCLTVGNETFVTTVCPPLPLNATAIELDAEACILAIDAAPCEEAADSDAGDEEEEEEAGVDGSADASDAGADVDVDAADASTD